jgi:hypothetical protein
MDKVIVLPYSETILETIRSLQFPFKISNDSFDTEGYVWDDSDIEPIKKRLHNKYVRTQQWSKMSDDERQDAVLLEKMLYQKEQDDYEVLSEEDSLQFLKDLKNGVFAIQ